MRRWERMFGLVMVALLVVAGWAGATQGVRAAVPDASPVAGDVPAAEETVDGATPLPDLDFTINGESGSPVSVDSAGSATFVVSDPDWISVEIFSSPSCAGYGYVMPTGAPVPASLLVATAGTTTIGVRTTDGERVSACRVMNVQAAPTATATATVAPTATVSAEPFLTINGSTSTALTVVSTDALTIAFGNTVVGFYYGTTCDPEAFSGSASASPVVTTALDLSEMYSLGSPMSIRGVVDEDSRTPTTTCRVLTLVDPTSTVAATATATATAEPTSTATEVPATATETATTEPTATATTEPTSTATSEPSATATAEPTGTATETLPTETATVEATSTATATATEEPSETATDVVTETATATATGTSEPTATATGTSEPTATATGTSEPTATATETEVPAFGDLQVVVTTSDGGDIPAGTTWLLSQLGPVGSRTGGTSFHAAELFGTQGGTLETALPSGSRLPIQNPVAYGQYTLTIDAPGYRAVSQSVTVDGSSGPEQTVYAALVPVSEPTATSAAPTSTATTITTTPAPTQASSTATATATATTVVSGLPKTGAGDGGSSPWPFVLLAMASGVLTLGLGVRLRRRG